MIFRFQRFLRDNCVIADNNLLIGDSDFPWDIGGYYRYFDYSGTIPFTAGNPVVPFQLPVQMFVPPVPGPVVLGQRLVAATIHATRALDGEPVLEGRDYKLQWLVDEPDAWWVYPTTVWTVPLVDIPVDLVLAEYDNVSYTPCPFGVPDTRLGFTPLSVGGLNPAYVRRGALNASLPPAEYALQWAAVRTGHVDRALSLKITMNPLPGPGQPYTYP
jgi:hypothetical protein